MIKKSAFEETIIEFLLTALFLLLGSAFLYLYIEVVTSERYFGLVASIIFFVFAAICIFSFGKNIKARTFKVTDLE